MAERGTGKRKRVKRRQNEESWPWHGDQCEADSRHGRCKLPASISPGHGDWRSRYCLYHYLLIVNGMPADDLETWTKAGGYADDFELCVLGRFPKDFDPDMHVCYECSLRFDLATMRSIKVGIHVIWRDTDCWLLWRQRLLEAKAKARPPAVAGMATARARLPAPTSGRDENRQGTNGAPAESRPAPKGGSGE